MEASTLIPVTPTKRTKILSDLDTRYSDETNKILSDGQFLIMMANLK